MVGIALALAGADVTLTDLPHIVALARENVAANCQSLLVRAQVQYESFPQLTFFDGHEASCD